MLLVPWVEWSGAEYISMIKELLHFSSASPLTSLGPHCWLLCPSTTSKSRQCRQQGKSTGHLPFQAQDEVLRILKIRPSSDLSLELQTHISWCLFGNSMWLCGRHLTSHGQSLTVDSLSAGFPNAAHLPQCSQWLPSRELLKTELEGLYLLPFFFLSPSVYNPSVSSTNTSSKLHFPLFPCTMM